jgi:hypothetical protein
MDGKQPKRTIHNAQAKKKEKPATIQLIFTLQRSHTLALK